MNQNNDNADKTEYKEENKDSLVNTDTVADGDEEVKIIYPPAPRDSVNKMDFYTSRQIKRELDRARKMKKQNRITFAIVLFVLAIFAAVIIYFAFPQLNLQNGSTLVAPVSHVGGIFNLFKHVSNAIGKFFSQTNPLTWIGLFK